MSWKFNEKSTELWQLPHNTVFKFKLDESDMFLFHKTDGMYCQITYIDEPNQIGYAAAWTKVHSAIE